MGCAHIYMGMSVYKKAPFKYGYQHEHFFYVTGTHTNKKQMNLDQYCTKTKYIALSIPTKSFHVVLIKWHFCKLQYSEHINNMHSVDISNSHKYNLQVKDTNYIQVNIIHKLCLKKFHFSPTDLLNYCQQKQSCKKSCSGCW